MKRILDPKFKYVPSHETDIAKTFERLKREKAKNTEEQNKKVTKLPVPRANTR